MIAAPLFEAVLNGGGVVADNADIEHGGGIVPGFRPESIQISPGRAGSGTPQVKA
jgi:hypothetical protein